MLLLICGLTPLVPGVLFPFLKTAGRKARVELPPLTDAPSAAPRLTGAGRADLGPAAVAGPVKQYPNQLAGGMVG